MEPFYYLHAELERVGGRGRGAATATTTLSVFGKDSAGCTVAVRIHAYRIHFYASFSDARLARHCCDELIGRGGASVGVVSIKNVTGFQSMLILPDGESGREAAGDREYSDTSLEYVVRVQVRTREGVAAAIVLVDGVVDRYRAEASVRGEHGTPPAAVNYYESNMDGVILATRDLGLDACRWCYLDTRLCCGGTDRDSDSSDDPRPDRRVADFVGREYLFWETGAVDPRRLFRAAAEAQEQPLPALPPPVKIMSFDIECLSSDADAMPDPDRDPVIQISTVTCDDALGRSREYRRRLFTLGGTCDPLDGAAGSTEVSAFRDERDMLRSFADHVRAEDPDVLTGYNVNEFDLPYLFGRMAANKVVPLFGRGRVAASCRKRAVEAVRQYASFLPKTHDTRIPGRVVFDMYAHLRKEVSLRSYTLNSVSSHFLGEKKEDVGYREIPTLFAGGAASRARLGRYCVKDAQLVLDLAFKTQTFVHAFERCKVFRTTLQYLIDRGQQVKFYAMLLAWCSERRILVNDLTSGGRRRPPTEMQVNSGSCEGNGSGGGVHETECSGDTEERTTAKRRRCVRDATTTTTTATAAGRSNERPQQRDGGGKTKRSAYDGATVLDPIAGIYRTPVVCLDYASLYPSIMIGYNLCFTTFVSDERRGRELATLGLAEESPIGHHFLARSVKRGVLPSILETLLDERAKVRELMTRVDEDTIQHRLLDGQQAALKMAANSIYGAIGCDKSVLHFVAIPASVTAYGRQLICQTKLHVEDGYPGVRVVYGDTDSVMVNLNDWDPSDRVWRCAEIGKSMAASVTRAIDRHPIRLQFETVYMPLLLFTKKRYAAVVHSGLERAAAAASEEEASALCRSATKYKGLQVVRRDNSPFSTRLMRLVLDSLMNPEGGGSVERATCALREELERLFDGRINPRELVISKEWKRKGTGNQPHDMLAQRMRARDPNSAPSIGDRVPYVVVRGRPGEKLCDRAEDPLYAMDHGLELDLLYYADNQVATPVAQLLRVVHSDKTVDQIKDTFWPAKAPARETDKRIRSRIGTVAGWKKKASVGSRLLTEYFASQHRPQLPNGPTEGASGVSTEATSAAIVDLEDVLDGLADTCMLCKANDARSVRSCRDHECETLYERFARRRELQKKLLLRPNINCDGIRETTTRRFSVVFG